MAVKARRKTRAGAEWLAELLRGSSSLHIALVGATIDEARRVMVEGESGLLPVAADVVEKWSPSPRFAGNNEALLFSGASPQALRGPEHHYA